MTTEDLNFRKDDAKLPAKHGKSFSYRTRMLKIIRCQYNMRLLHSADENGLADHTVTKTNRKKTQTFTLIYRNVSKVPQISLGQVFKCSLVRHTQHNRRLRSPRRGKMRFASLRTDGLAAQEGERSSYRHKRQMKHGVWCCWMQDTRLLQVLVLLLTTAHEGFGVKPSPGRKPDIATLHRASARMSGQSGPTVEAVQ